MESPLRALRPAVRSLWRDPGFTLAALLTLSLGLGANIAVLSASYGVLIKPLPFRDAERLVLIRAEADYTGSNKPTRLSLQSRDLDTWTRSATMLRRSVFYDTGVEALTSEHGSELLDTSDVAGNFFAEMDGPFAAGRPFLPGEVHSSVVVISARLADRVFGGADSAVGKTLRLKPRNYTIVGVAGRAFDFPTETVDAWLPADFSATASPSCCSFEVMARLEGTATPEAAAEEARALFGAAPSFKGNGPSVRVRAMSLAEARSAPARPALRVLSAAAALLFLAACFNVVNLLLARNATREAEFAVRRTLGAPALSLVSQLAIEGALLSLVGAVFGLTFAASLLRLMAGLAAGTVPRLGGIGIDPQAVLIGVALSALATIGTTIVPALRALAGSTVPTRTRNVAGGGRGAHSLQKAMCGAQVAVAITLLIGAAVMNRSLVKLLDVDLGVSRDHVLTASLNLAFGENRDDTRTLLRVERVVEAIATTPGVRAVGVGAAVPPHLARMQVTLRREGDVVDYRVAAVPATPGYFSALRLRLREGRFFGEADTRDGPPVMVMTEETARRFFGDHALGKTMSLPRLRDGKVISVPMTLVGIVQDVKYSGLAAPPDDGVYVPFTQQPWIASFLVIRTEQAPSAFAAGLRRRIAEGDPDIVVGEVATLDQLVSGQAAGPRSRTVLLSVIAALALGIAAAGLYGMVAYSVARRTREVGIRVAVGATAADIVRMIMGETMAVGVAGAAVGVGLAWSFVTLLTGLVYGIAPTDPVSFIGASAALLLALALAGFVPARRASRMSPTDALRSD